MSLQASLSVPKNCWSVLQIDPLRPRWPDGYSGYGGFAISGSQFSSRLVASRSGPARKYYRPTESGRALLASRTRAWKALVAIVEPLLASAVPARPKEAEAA